MTTSTHTERLYRDCKSRIADHWGKHVRELLGEQIYRALLCQEVLQLCCSSLADDADPAIVRNIMNYCYDRIIDEVQL